MTANVGTADRAIRFAVGLVLLLLVAIGSLSGTAAWIGGIVGVVMLATAGMRFCPAYRLLGVSTCKV
ncbi:MAG: DUF2892 domain-containing protein [Rhodobacteraceae bacterium]|nr:DUF2892 domain-containing protein [Paracoccaceae bacterium]